MLITVDKEILNQLVMQMEKDKLYVFNPQFVREIVESIKHPKEKSIDSSLKTLPQGIAKEIASYIQKGEFEESTQWSKKLVAHGYAEKLFNAALDRKQTDECYDFLQQLLKLFEDEGWVALLEDPNIRFSDKNKVLRLAGDNQLVLNLIYKLLDKHETGLLSYIIDEYRNLLLGSSVVRAEVTTAIPIDQEYEKKIIKYIERMFTGKVIPFFSVDPEILGGIVIRVGDKVLDRSLRNRLLLLHKAIKSLG